MTYTADGAAENLAAHLEAHTKVVGRPTLIDEDTRAGLGDAFRVESHGPTRLKARRPTVLIYSVTATG